MAIEPTFLNSWYLTQFAMGVVLSIGMFLLLTGVHDIPGE